MPSFKIIRLLVLEEILKVFTIYGHGGHLGHVICTIYTCINFLSHCPRRLHMKFGFGQAVSEKIFENNGYIHVYSPGAGGDNPLVQFFY